MGWNSWNSGIPLTEQTVEDTIDAMVSSGMRDAGYRYVNLDAGLGGTDRDAHGDLRADPDRFPHGIAALAQLRARPRHVPRASITAPSTRGAVRTPRIGGAGHEQSDARTIAGWGVDYLKYDWCRADADHDEQVKYFVAMRDALRASGRHDRLQHQSRTVRMTRRPVPSTTGHASPTSVATETTWCLRGVMPRCGARGCRASARRSTTAATVTSRHGVRRPVHVNDPDMLVVGIPWATFVTGHPTMSLGPQRPDLTDAEQRAHFSLWAMLAAPLLAGNDVRTMTAADARHPHQPRRHRRRSGSAGRAGASALAGIRG